GKVITKLLAPLKGMDSLILTFEISSMTLKNSFL
ncbi:MAG: hypothetical protein ACI9UV_001682, partial [Algoriphagus sp.]